MAEDAERVQKLKEKYNQLKQANATLKKGFLDKQEECNRLEEQIKEKETTIRQQLEEIDRLQYQNGRMTKQVSTLTAQVEEQKKTHTQSTWSMGGLISGKQQQEAIQKAESDLAVLRDELMMKIQENEELHMRVFEAQKQHNEEAERLRDTEATRGRDLERYSAQLKASKEEVERLGIDNKKMVERLGTLDHQLSASAQLSESLRQQLDRERCEAQNVKAALQRRFARWVPFDWAQHDLWTGFSFSSQRGRMAKQRHQALQDLYSAVQQACRHCCGALQTWPNALIGGGDEESASRLRIRGKVADVAQELSSCIQQVPMMAEMLGSHGLVLQDAARQELRRRSNDLLVIHRRWVLYQSLLLHDWQSTAGRSSQEEALAQSFVDCLWRLHRCVRSLVSHLRVATLLPDLSTGNTSAAHFALARRKLGRKGGASGAETKQPGLQAAQRLSLVQRSLADVSHCWKALGRCLSSWAAASAGSTGSSPTSSSQGHGGVVGLLGCIHGLCACLTEQLLPMVEKLATQATGQEMPLLLSACALARQSTEVDDLGLYAQGVKKQLESAPDVIAMQESLKLLALSRRLSATRVQLLSDLRQQGQRLQALSNEKTKLSLEINNLQDRHALLQSNYDVIKASQVSSEDLNSTEISGNSTELLLSSRQRALLGSLAVTTQESSGMRQHGFFVDVLSLDNGEASLAAGAPHPETLDAWELAVRKVYEQHVLRLQKQMLIADSKALEMGLNVQDFRDQIQRQEEEKQDLSDQVSSTKKELDSLREDMEATRKNYDGQLGMLTEHICALSARLSEKDASLASLQAKKVLCGRCGMWNTMGKLLAEPGAGTYQTCKEKVLSTD